MCNYYHLLYYHLLKQHIFCQLLPARLNFTLPNVAVNLSWLGYQSLRINFIGVKYVSYYFDLMLVVALALTGKVMNFVKKSSPDDYTFTSASRAIKLLQIRIPMI